MTYLSGLLSAGFYATGPWAFSATTIFKGKVLGMRSGDEVASNVTCCKSLRLAIKVVISAVVFSQKRKNTLNHRYMETNTKPLVSVRKLHKHRRSRLKSFFEVQILPPLRHRLPQCGFKNCDIPTNTQIISI